MSAVDLKIRRAEASRDIELLSALGTTTFYEAYFEQDESRDLAAYCVAAFSTRQMQSELNDKNSTFFIAELSGHAVGYAKLREGTTAEGVENLNAVELQRIYILEKAKGKGVGMELMQKCFAEAVERGFETIWLGVWRFNLAAQKFYARFGFEKVGELFFEYGAGLETNYVLAKKL